MVLSVTDTRTEHREQDMTIAREANMKAKCYQCGRVFGRGEGECSFEKLIGGQPICLTCIAEMAAWRSSSGDPADWLESGSSFDDVTRAYEECR